jgi:hypothetical protein
MKTPTGRVSDEQTEMIIALQHQRNMTAVCRSSEEAIKEIQEYLALDGGCDE